MKMDLKELMNIAEHHAREHADGHLTLMRFTTGWKCFIGTPDLDSGAGRDEVWDQTMYQTVEEALAAFIDGANSSPNAQAQLPPERPKAAEGTQSAPAFWAVNCSALLGDCIARHYRHSAERSPRFVAGKFTMLRR